jgi:hypothetical protein
MKKYVLFERRGTGSVTMGDRWWIVEGIKIRKQFYRVDAE